MDRSARLSEIAFAEEHSAQHAYRQLLCLLCGEDAIGHIRVGRFQDDPVLFFPKMLDRDFFTDRHDGDGAVFHAVAAADIDERAVADPVHDHGIATDPQKEIALLIFFVTDAFLTQVVAFQKKVIAGFDIKWYP